MNIDSNNTELWKQALKLLFLAIVLTSTSAAVAQTFDQRRILVVSGGDFNDTNANNLLNVGEMIDYDHTVLNLGNVPLQNIILTDITGTVTCPQSTLGPDTAMTCISTHSITTTEATNGTSLNSISVSGETAGGAVTSSNNTVQRSNNQSRNGIKLLKAPLTINDADSSGFNSIGDLIEYSFVVKNSNSNDLGLITLTEPDPSRIDTPIVCPSQTLGGAAFSGNNTGMLLTQDVVVCTANYTIRQLDLDNGSVNNSAQVQAVPLPLGVPITGTAASVTGVEEFTPDILPDPSAVPALGNFGRIMLFIMLALVALIVGRLTLRKQL
ncbi:MAG: hypothetical protein PF630_12810 [Gammaproteobacteria bacterium]|jgi:uncharacterized repeat protein (TIGR01451 family)|nr:hypothetical protein [Gammaproteobacteria bacterium]